MDCDLDEKTAAMVAAKRPAEASELSPIPSEKRLMVSRDQVEDIFQTRYNTLPEDCPVRIDKDEEDEYNPLSYHAVRMTDAINVIPKTTRDQPALCSYCLEITDHFPSYCKLNTSPFPEPPSPTPEDVENNRSYCSICLNYTDHDYNDCPRVCYDNRDSDHDSDWDY